MQSGGVGGEDGGGGGGGLEWNSSVMETDFCSLNISQKKNVCFHTNS